MRIDYALNQLSLFRNSVSMSNETDFLLPELSIKEVFNNNSITVDNRNGTENRQGHRHVHLSGLNCAGMISKGYVHNLKVFVGINAESLQIDYKFQVLHRAGWSGDLHYGSRLLATHDLIPQLFLVSR